MRAMLLVPVAVAVLTSAHAADYDWPVVDALDGSTAIVDAPADTPPELAEVIVRLKDVDALGEPRACTR